MSRRSARCSAVPPETKTAAGLQDASMSKSIGHFIGGKRVEGHSRRQANVYNPATGEIAAQVALASAADTEQAIAAAQAAFAGWSAVTT